MVLFSNVVFLLAAIISGAIKKWRDYYKTIVYLSFCNLLYNFLCRDYLTWSYHPDFLLSHQTADLVNTLILLPSSAILYLNFFPVIGIGKKVLYYFAWIIGFSTLEYIWYRRGVITYEHGWNILWSIVFYCAMFFSLWLHHRSTGKALIFSLVSVILLLLIFKVPFWK
ncbi:CBO0543 family protein [Paenibacillus cremeus]|uniref:Uncharacterized protein n=1 Tax=Paenibacillus cremeus TaxID=2163881 RepID=A0A559JHT2_9BACL|nr:CBO0543 family protein [Paenibacillus cremeus]TVX99426.1 hypothetical protein FPZ49_33675 [Paenibacillus cremeus]